MNSDVRNPQGEDVGKINDIMVDITSGRVAYAVLSFGGFLGFGDKLFAIPFKAIEINEQSGHVILNVPKEKLEASRGFDKDNWPDMSDSEWALELHEFYQSAGYWEE